LIIAIRLFWGKRHVPKLHSLAPSCRSFPKAALILELDVRLPTVPAGVTYPSSRIPNAEASSSVVSARRHADARGHNWHLGGEIMIIGF
jgi:hypothetical protein